MTERIPYPYFAKGTLVGPARETALCAVTYALGLADACDNPDERLRTFQTSVSTALAMLPHTVGPWGPAQVALKQVMRTVSSMGYDGFRDMYTVPPPPLNTNFRQAG